ncbi:transcriptional regulator [Opitutaceae bacterium TAV1]|nr:transcriptional regulator [Opitutaceae bacterium TAV1]
MSGSTHRSPTLQDIADRTGFSRSAVSLALRGHPSLPAATRDAICKAAAAIGYRPNPLVAALMAQLRDRRRQTASRRETIAVVHRHPAGARRASPSNYYYVLRKALLREAAARGLDVDEFHHERGRMPDARLSQVLLAREIHGVVLFPGSSPGDPGLEYPDLDWPGFTTVLIGSRTCRREFHQVVADHTWNIDLALEHACAGGARRIGMAVPEAQDRATNHVWASRFLLYQNGISRRDRVPLFSPPGGTTLPPALLVDWVRRHRPEVILISGSGVRDHLAAAGIHAPRHVRLINLAQRGEKDLAGINPHTEEVGRAAVELLVSMLQANQRGLPEFPRVISVKGRWAPGASFPEFAGS